MIEETKEYIIEQLTDSPEEEVAIAPISSSHADRKAFETAVFHLHREGKIKLWRIVSKDHTYVPGEGFIAQLVK